MLQLCQHLDQVHGNTGETTVNAGRRRGSHTGMAACLQVQIL